MLLYFLPQDSVTGLLKIIHVGKSDSTFLSDVLYTRGSGIIVQALN